MYIIGKKIRNSFSSGRSNRHSHSHNYMNFKRKNGGISCYGANHWCFELLLQCRTLLTPDLSRFLWTKPPVFLALKSTGCSTRTQGFLYVVPCNIYSCVLDMLICHGSCCEFLLSLLETGTRRPIYSMNLQRKFQQQSFNSSKRLF